MTFYSKVNIKMQVVNIKTAQLRKSGYENLAEWNENETNVYIGRACQWVKGANKSKWANPFPLSKYTLEESLEKYEEYIRKGPLWDQLEELEGKTLGCWCKPAGCHGDILCKLVNEKHTLNKKNKY